MKHLKSYKLFESNKESQEVAQEISDIFIHVKDCGLEVADVYSGHALSMGDRDIITDHNEFSTILGPDGRYVGSYKSLSIRLKPIERGVFVIADDFFDELQSSIKHVESQFNLLLGSIYLRTFDGVWFNNVDTMEKYINELPFAKRSSLRHVLYLDLTFKDIEEDIDDSVSVKESVDVNELESIFDDVKDISSRRINETLLTQHSRRIIEKVAYSVIVINRDYTIRSCTAIHVAHATIKTFDLFHMKAETR
jgi:hypothetical protein